ncbi:MAG: hypothetical protein Q8P41_31900 [Pseudomonadota bacterium]|nr:hypothetical protein [Pseudomonadota bacterium]
MGKAGRPPAKPVRRLGPKRGPAPKLDNRKDAAELLEELRQPGAKLAAISRRLRVNVNTLRAFRDRNIPKMVREADARLSRLPRPDLQVSQLERLDAIASKLDMMVDAIHRTLLDPEDPTRYNLDPRAREITVMVEETVGDRTVSKVRKLDELLARVESGLKVDVVRWEIKSVDPKVLLKDLAATIKPIAELLGKTRGEIKPDPTATLNVFLGGQEWARAEAALLEALRPWPHAIEAAGVALAALAEAPNGR